MANLAGQGRSRHVVTRLDSRRHPGKRLAGMAGRTTADDAGMVHHCAGEIGELAGRVAGLAR